MSSAFTHPKFTGIGLGLRACHYADIETQHPKVPWFEVLSDNYLLTDTPARKHLAAIRERYPMTLHCVGMSLGSTDKLNLSYFKQLKSLIDVVEPMIVSDHLAWTSLADRHFHELLPLPYTEEAVSHVADRICQVQDILQRQIMIENVSTYLNFTHSSLMEWEFLQAVVDRADAYILLDINNVYVSAMNNHFDPEKYLSSLSPTKIAQFHLAGFEDKGTHLLDTHGAQVHKPVWELYRKALQYFGPIPAAIEWDNQIPSFVELQNESRTAENILEHYVNTSRATEAIC